MRRDIDIPHGLLICPSHDDTTGPQKLRIEPRMEPRDEAALLLTVAAEVEHALMVQYLYAAYSVRYDQPQISEQAAARNVHLSILQIAREEMGHLMTVQNLLHLIGAPLNLERQHSPFESQLYPFRFKLERLSLHSLAKYVTAERPLNQPEGFPDEDWAKLTEISKMAARANDGRPVQHVGPIFARLMELFEGGDDGLADDDFKINTLDLQATWNDWGYDESLDNDDDSRRVLVETFEGTNPDSLRNMAIEAIAEIGEQGEGFGDEVDSHFERFFQLYMDFKHLAEQGVEFVWPVATNPNTSSPQTTFSCAGEPVDAIRAAAIRQGCITNERARAWGHLFNMRYRLLLSMLSHFLHIIGPRYVASGTDAGDRTPRGFLMLWTFDEMRHLRKIAQKLAQLPLRDPDDGENAGAPFRLPYTLAIPAAEVDRWRTHLDVLRASVQFVESEFCSTGCDDEFDPFLKDLQLADKRSIEILQSLVDGQSVPTASQPTAFQKAATILEEAVRGFTIEAHGNFWTGLDRDTFVDLHMFNSNLVGRDDNCDLTPNRGLLIGQLDARNRSKTGMPRYRPPVDPSRIQYLTEWIRQQAPDNEPPNEPGVKHERDPAREDRKKSRKEVSATPGFAADIRPMFREFDVESIRKFDQIDLNDLNDVKRNLDRIKNRFESGSLPYDANWTAEQIELFTTWVNNGMPD